MSGWNEQFVNEIADAVVSRLSGAGRSVRLMKLPAAAEYLGMSPESLRLLVINHRIPAVREDADRGHFRLDIKDLDKWIEEHKSV